MAVSAVLFLTLAASAHAFTVDIIEPVDDQCVLAVGRSYDFEAVAYDSQQQDITSQVTWSWDFDEGSDPDDDNPTTHTFDDAATCNVTVTGTWNAQQAQDTVRVQALPGWVADSLVYVRPAGATHLGYGGGLVFDGEVCDAVEVVWETDQIDVHSARFYVRNPDDSISWISDEEQPDVLQPGGQQPSYEQAVSPEIMTAGWFPNQTKTYGVRVGREYGTPDGPEWEYFDRDISFTSNNTAVTECDDGLIIHKEGAEPFEFRWSIRHHEQVAYCDAIQSIWSWTDPQFYITIAVYDLSGNQVRLIQRPTTAQTGAGSEPWDGKIGAAGSLVDAPYGIYTYRVWASHDVECEDSAASYRLHISDVRTLEGPTFSYMSFSPQEQRLEYGIRYELSRDAADGGSWLRVYNRHLNLVHVKQVDHTAGINSVLGEFQTDPAVTGAYHFVISSVETDADGLLNRNATSKLATPRGVTWSVYPRISLHRDAQDALWPQDIEATVGVWHDETRYIPRVENSLPGYRSAVIDSWENDAVWHVFGHGGTGAAQIARDWPSEPATRYFVQKKWDQPGTISRDFAWGSDVAVDTEDGYPNLLLVTLQTCWSAYDASDIGSAMAGGQDAGAAASLGFNGVIGGGSVGAAWVHAFYAYAMDPQNPGRSVAEAADHAQEVVRHTFGSYHGYETVLFAGDSGISLLDGGAKWGN